jgi:hypothetical protein
MMRAMTRFGLCVILVGWGITAQAEEALPDTENGRYALSPIAGGVLRVDTRSGLVSTCKDSGQGWACYGVPDERAAFDAEIGRLQAENQRLRTQLAQRETAPGKTDEALPKSDPLVPSVPRSADGERKIEIPLPSERDMNRFMGFLEEAWKRLVDIAARIQRSPDDKI